VKKQGVLPELKDNNFIMSAELVKLPNANLKITKANISSAPEFLSMPLFKNNCTVFDILNKKAVVKGEEADILIILFHLYLTKREKDGLLYINTDDILTLRSVKKNKAGYKKEVRKRINSRLKNLQNTGLFNFIDYKDFNYILDFNLEDEIEKIIPFNQKLLALNPLTKSWHKAIGLYLTLLKYDSKRKTHNAAIIQIKKLLNLISCYSLFPFQIRQRLEDVLDELSLLQIIKCWQYKNIDEDMLCSKNWLFFWKQLSVKIFF